MVARCPRSYTASLASLAVKRGGPPHPAMRAPEGRCLVRSSPSTRSPSRSKTWRSPAPSMRWPCGGAPVRSWRADAVPADQARASRPSADRRCQSRCSIANTRPSIHALDVQALPKVGFLPEMEPVHERDRPVVARVDRSEDAVLAQIAKQPVEERGSGEVARSVYADSFRSRERCQNDGRAAAWRSLAPRKQLTDDPAPEEQHRG